MAKNKASDKLEEKNLSDFVVVIAKRDDEQFRQFVTGHYDKILRTITRTKNASNLWAVGKSGRSVWETVKKGNKIYFGRYGMRFSHYGIVSKTLDDESIPVKIWGDSPRIRGMKQIILFSSVHDISEPFGAFCRKAGIRPSDHASGIYPAGDGISGNIKDVTGTVIMKGNDDSLGRTLEVITRFIRDTKKVKLLKKKYHDRCQVCGYSIKTPTGSRYSEVHHIYPLGDGGGDDFGNMLVLCPTHHVEFDYKVVGILEDKKTIIDMHGNAIGSLMVMKEHKIHIKNIQFHLSEMNLR